MSHQELVISEKHALQNALTYFEFHDIVELHLMQESINKRKSAKFFLQFKDQNSSPVLNYENMNNYILGMAAMKKVINNQ